jgi:hypothetical protein
MTAAIGGIHGNSSQKDRPEDGPREDPRRSYQPYRGTALCPRRACGEANSFADFIES